MRVTRVHGSSGQVGDKKAVLDQIFHPKLATKRVLNRFDLEKMRTHPPRNNHFHGHWDNQICLGGGVSPLYPSLCTPIVTPFVEYPSHNL